MSTARHLGRLGAAALVAGAVLLLASTLLHPMGADPADAPAAFAEYAADPRYAWTHLGQFAGFLGIGAGLVAFAGSFEPGRAAAWARLGAAGAVASLAVAAALQAVDGVALKATVDRWAAASEEMRPVVFEAALAVRRVEIGLAGFLGVMSGATLIAFGLAVLRGGRYPAGLGAVGLLDGTVMVAAGAAQASVGFAEPAMTLSMLTGSVFLAWSAAAGILMRRWAARPDRDGDAA